LAYIEDKYTDPEVNKLLNTAGFLDPRSKTNFINSEELGTIKNNITVEAMIIATKEREARDDREGETKVDLTNVTHDGQGHTAKKKR